jgi:hypothetical protein
LDDARLVKRVYAVPAADEHGEVKGEKGWWAWKTRKHAKKSHKSSKKKGPPSSLPPFLQFRWPFNLVRCFFFGPPGADRFSGVEGADDELCFSL